MRWVPPVFIVTANAGLYHVQLSPLQLLLAITARWYFSTFMYFLNCNTQWMSWSLLSCLLLLLFWGVICPLGFLSLSLTTSFHPSCFVSIFTGIIYTFITNFLRDYLTSDDGLLLLPRSGHVSSSPRWLIMPFSSLPRSQPGASSSRLIDFSSLSRSSSLSRLLLLCLVTLLFYFSPYN